MVFSSSSHANASFQEANPFHRDERDVPRPSNYESRVLITCRRELTLARRVHQHPSSSNLLPNSRYPSPPPTLQHHDSPEFSPSAISSNVLAQVSEHGTFFAAAQVCIHLQRVFHLLPPLNLLLLSQLKLTINSARQRTYSRRPFGLVEKREALQDSTG
jgi:hypothetical protein